MVAFRKRGGNGYFKELAKKIGLGFNICHMTAGEHEVRPDEASSSCCGANLVFAHLPAELNFGRR